eukprot:scaffold169166_cov19-Tisochrysis_lutea.AAC.1
MCGCRPPLGEDGRRAQESGTSVLQHITDVAGKLVSGTLIVCMTIAWFPSSAAHHRWSREACVMSAHCPHEHCMERVKKLAIGLLIVRMLIAWFPNSAAHHRCSRNAPWAEAPQPAPNDDSFALKRRQTGSQLPFSVTREHLLALSMASKRGMALWRSSSSRVFYLPAAVLSRGKR